MSRAKVAARVMAPEPRPVSVEGGAELLGVSRFTLRKWLRERRLPFHQLGRRIVLDRGDLEAFLRANRVEARELRP